MSSDPFAGLPVLQDARPDAHRTGLVRDLFFTLDTITAAAQALLTADYHLEDISGLDTREGLLISYHFDHFENPGRMALRVLAPHHTPSVPSIAQLFGGAEWHERELSDFFGVVFEGNPNPAPLLLPEADVTAPLLKAEKNRIAIGDLIHPGSIRHKDEAFTLFAPKNSPDPEAQEAES